MEAAFGLPSPVLQREIPGMAELYREFGISSGPARI
jgi:hypothetical protein